MESIQIIGEIPPFIMNRNLATSQQPLKFQLALVGKLAALTRREFVLLEEQECNFPPQFARGYFSGPQDVIRDDKTYIFASLRKNTTCS
jgi:hypothetical protein